MGFLDKLKPQPRWKHADPAVRLEALRDLNDPQELAQIGEADPDAKVRRAAVGDLTDAACLGRIASGDSDTDVRERAAERLVFLACRPVGAESAEVDTASAFAAVRALTD